MSTTVEMSKHESILDAATRVFAKRGMHQSTMDEIAAEAGVGKGTLYLYFASKTELMESVCERAMTMYLTELEKICCQDSPTRDIVTRLVEVTIQYASNNRSTARMMMEGALGFRTEFKRQLLEHRAKTRRLMLSVIERGVDRGDVRTLQPHAATEVLLGTLNSLAASYLSPSYPEQVTESDCQSYTDVLWNGIGV